MINPKFISETMKDMDMRFFLVEDNYGRTIYQQFQNISLDEAIKRYNKFIDNSQLTHLLILHYSKPMKDFAMVDLKKKE